MRDQPHQSPSFADQAADLAAMMADAFGHGALAGAKAGLRRAGELADPWAVELWSEVHAILAVQDRGQGVAPLP